MNENMITVTGNLCAEPEVRQTRNGADMVTFRVASTHRYYSNRTGEWEEGVTNYYDVVAYRLLAQNAGKSLHKGDAVIVQGQFKQRRFERQDGTTGMACEIEARVVGPDLAYGISQFLRRPRSQSNGQPGNGHSGNGHSGNAPAGNGQAAGQRPDPWQQTGSSGADAWVNTESGEVSDRPLDPHRTGYQVQRDHEPLETYPAREIDGDVLEVTDVDEDAETARDSHQDEHVKEPVG